MYTDFSLMLFLFSTDFVDNADLWPVRSWISQIGATFLPFYPFTFLPLNPFYFFTFIVYTTIFCQKLWWIIFSDSAWTSPTAVWLPMKRFWHGAPSRSGRTSKPKPMPPCVAPYDEKDTLLQGFRCSHWLGGGEKRDYGSFTVAALGGKLRLQPFCDMIRMQTETEIICFMLSVKRLK